MTSLETKINILKKENKKQFLSLKKNEELRNKFKKENNVEQDKKLKKVSKKKLAAVAKFLNFLKTEIHQF